MASALPADPEWGIVELMGHVRLAGRISEVERFGAKLGRVDVPDVSAGATPEAVFLTQLFSGSSLYRYTYCTEETARRVAAESQPSAPARLQLPARVDDDDLDDEPNDTNADEMPY